MENRIGKVVFDRTFLYEGLDKEDLLEIINALPEDATLVGISENYNNMTVGMVFHSSEFKVVAEAQEIPNIIPHFKKYMDIDGVTFGTLEKLDMTQVMEPIDVKTDLIIPYNDVDKLFLEEQSYLKKIMEDVYKWEIDKLLYGSFTGKVNEWGKIGYVNPYEVHHVKLDDENPQACYDPKIIQNCDHVWNTYEGFTKKYDYCTKCDAKKE